MFDRARPVLPTAAATTAADAIAVPTQNTHSRNSSKHGKLVHLRPSGLRVCPNGTFAGCTTVPAGGRGHQ